MKKIIVTLLSILLILSCSACSTGNSSTFNIEFIDVGQGDSALVECDGHYMLVDAGDKSHGNNVNEILIDKDIHSLDILVATHIHDDHIGGFENALSGIVRIGTALCNTDSASTTTFLNFQNDLASIGTQIAVPQKGDKYQLGSASVEVIDNGTGNDENSSIVLLITYKKTTFLLTGDMPDESITEFCNNHSTSAGDIEILGYTLLKVAHHGARDNTTYQFLRIVEPRYAVISVGRGNSYGHPNGDTLDLLDDADIKVYRTDYDGNIKVASNGKELKIDTSK